MRKVPNRAAVTAVGVLTAAAGLGLWTTAPAAHAATDICVDPVVTNPGDLCCDGHGKAVVDVLGEGLICVAIEEPDP